MSSTTTLPSNDLMSPPKSGRFQLIVTAVAKSKDDADTIQKMAKDIQKRALSDEEKDTHGYRVIRSVDDQKTVMIFEEYEHADALLKTHMDGAAFKTLLSKLESLIETMNVRFYQE